MTEHVVTGATTNFIIVTQEQMDALNMLLFLLVRAAHTHMNPDPHCDRLDAREMHDWLAKWEGTKASAPRGGGETRPFGTLTLGGEWADGARPFYFRATGDEGPVEPAGQVQGDEAAAALGEAFARFNAKD